VREAAERVRRAVEALGIAHPSNPPFGIVTISVGATEMNLTDATQADGHWFARVDAAMYQAKSEGRNRVAVAPRTSAIVRQGPTLTGASSTSRSPLEVLP
jgi:PleD family two-component response regulator